LFALSSGALGWVGESIPCPLWCLWLGLWPGGGWAMVLLLFVVWAVAVGLGLGVWPGLGCAMAWAVGVTVTRSSG
jgi:hypothetical protein